MKDKNTQKDRWLFRNRSLIIRSLLAICLFLGVAHQLFAFWERPAWMMLVASVVCVPVFIKISSRLIDWIVQSRQCAERKRFLLFLGFFYGKAYFYLVRIMIIALFFSLYN